MTNPQQRLHESAQVMLRLYRDGLGPSGKLRAVFLGRCARDQQSLWWAFYILLRAAMKASIKLNELIDLIEDAADECSVEGGGGGGGSFPVPVFAGTHTKHSMLARAADSLRELCHALAANTAGSGEGEVDDKEGIDSDDMGGVSAGTAAVITATGTAAPAANTTITGSQTSAKSLSDLLTLLKLESDGKAVKRCRKGREWVASLHRELTEGGAPAASRLLADAILLDSKVSALVSRIHAWVEGNGAATLEATARVETEDDENDDDYYHYDGGKDDGYDDDTDLATGAVTSDSSTAASSKPSESSSSATTPTSMLRRAFTGPRASLTEKSRGPIIEAACDALRAQASTAKWLLSMKSVTTTARNASQVKGDSDGGGGGGGGGKEREEAFVLRRESLTARKLCAALEFARMALSEVEGNGKEEKEGHEEIECNEKTEVNGVAGLAIHEQKAVSDEEEPAYV